MILWMLEMQADGRGVITTTGSLEIIHTPVFIQWLVVDHPSTIDVKQHHIDTSSFLFLVIAIHCPRQSLVDNNRIGNHDLQ
jgi:hypothetical protein